MEKLIELLNEYEKEVKKSEIVWSIDNDWDICSQTYEWVDYNEYTKYMNTSKLISKSFGFIKWLVENDKIDLWKIKKLYRKSNEHSVHTYPIMYEYSDLENLLMLLSISSSPIDDLISYLK